MVWNNALHSKKDWWKHNIRQIKILVHTNKIMEQNEK